MPSAWERGKGEKEKQDQKYCSVLISSHKRDIKNGQDGREGDEDGLRKVGPVCGFCFHLSAARHLSFLIECGNNGARLSGALAVAVHVCVYVCVGSLRRGPSRCPLSG